MTDFNHFHILKKSNEYTRILFQCNRCLTPQYANREKDLPKFCPVCHTITAWKYIRRKHG